jgi:hypothetical protein
LIRKGMYEGSLLYQIDPNQSKESPW